MGLQNFKAFHDPNLTESRLDDLAGDLSDFGFIEKKWTWSEIQSAWHKIEWEEIIFFTLFNTQYHSFYHRLKFNFDRNGYNKPILSVKTNEPFTFLFRYDELAGTMKKILNGTKTGVSGQRYTLPQILDTISYGIKGQSHFSIPEIFDYNLKKFKVEEDNPNLWVDFGLACLPQPNQDTKEFEVRVVDMVLKVNWDEVADLMCTPNMMKELKIKLDEIAGF
jgi:hypothetical protein